MQNIIKHALKNTLVILCCISPLSVQAAELCRSIFTNTPQSNLGNRITPPSNLPSKNGNFTCPAFSFRCFFDDFSNGDFNYNNGLFSDSISRSSYVSTSETTTRLYFDSLTLNDMSLNLNGDARNLIIYVRGNLNMSNNSHINGLVYVAGAVSINGSSSIRGGLASGGAMAIFNSTVDVQSQEVEAANFNGMCLNEFDPLPIVPPKILFGKSSASAPNRLQRVSFPNELQFANGVTPLIFMTPTINANNTSGDGPASIRIENVDESGFSWQQVEPPIRRGQRNNSEAMRDVGWIAVEPGIHMLSDGRQWAAGSRVMNSSFNFSDDPWTAQTIGSQFSLGISQIQTNNNSNCWLTSVSEISNEQIRLSLDPSLAYDENPSGVRCPRSGQRTLNNETVAYIVFEPGTGDVTLNGQRIHYQFGSGFNRPDTSGGWTLDQQCGFMNNLSGFNVAPIFIGKKASRKGPQGGWYRRCQLSENQVSMVIDEDLYSGNRKHLAEAFNYMAFEVMDDVAPSIDHFEMSYIGTPLTCRTQDVTIKACANASCSELVTEQVSATLNPLFEVEDGGWYRNNSRVNSVSFSGGQVQVGFRNYNRGSIRLNMSNSSPAISNQTLCGSESNSLRTESLCTLTFANRGFEVLAPNKYANKPNSLSIKALRRDPSDPDECIADFIDQTKNVNFHTEYLVPNDPVNQAQVTIGTQEISNEPTAPTSMNVSFNHEGIATLGFNYPDAGKISIHAVLIRIDDAISIPVVGTGSFVSVPYGLCFEVKDALASCGTNDENCSIYKTAGSLFSLSLQAKAWRPNDDGRICNNLDTRNYATELNSHLSLSSKVVAPSSGDDGFLAASIGNGEDYSYIQGNNDFQRSISESGIFKFTATAPDSYLGVSKESLPIHDGVTANVGRFVPSYFDVSAGNITQKCTGFTYLSQPFDLDFTIQAKNIQGAITTNYRGAFAKANGALVGDDSLKVITSRLFSNDDQVSNDIPSSLVPFVNGVASVHLNPIFNRLLPSSTNKKDGPFVNLRFGIMLNDGEDSTSLARTELTNKNFTAGANCTSDCAAKRLASDVSSIVFRHGRIVISNAYGPGNKPLKSAISAEYWNGSNWQINELDNCTNFNSAALTASATYEPQLKGNQSVVRYLPNNLSMQLQLGQSELFWRNDGSSEYHGQVTDEFNLGDKSYLNWYWNRNRLSNEINQLQNPYSSAYFGQFSGHNKVIYWREVNP